MNIVQTNCTIHNMTVNEHQKSDSKNLEELLDTLQARLQSDVSLLHSVKQSMLVELETTRKSKDSQIKTDTLKSIAQTVSGFGAFAGLAKAILEMLG